MSIKESFVWRIRTWVYVVGILAFVIAVTVKWAREAKTNLVDIGSILVVGKSEFWPPDMIPHPHLPGDGPKPNPIHTA